MARGRPVVASPVGIQLAQVRHGETGLLAASDAELVDAVRALAGDAGLRRRMGEAAREDVRARWSVDAWQARVTRHVTAALS
jgi:glycosyltransferase involved in cell wall biosynthesis